MKVKNDGASRYSEVISKSDIALFLVFPADNARHENRVCRRREAHSRQEIRLPIS